MRQTAQQCHFDLKKSGQGRVSGGISEVKRGLF